MIPLRLGWEDLICNIIDQYPSLAYEKAKVVSTTEGGGIVVQLVGDGNYRSREISMPVPPKKESIKNFKEFEKMTRDEEKIEELENKYYWDVEAGSLNEEGWKMVADDTIAPGEPAGYRPDLDRILILPKALVIAQALVEKDFYHIPEMYYIGEAADLCRKRKRYDHYSIVQALFEVREEHGDFWKEQAKGILSGKDKRDRCWCGALSRSWSSKFGHRCEEHYNQNEKGEKETD